MFCEKCGTPIQNGDRFCMNCGTELVAVTGNEQSEQNAAPIVDDGILRCCDCGMEIKENEKYCIGCGAAITNNVKDEKTGATEMELGLQTELFEIFNSNKVMQFFFKYCMVFVLIYPIYSLVGRWDFLDAVHTFLTRFSIIFFFVYNIGLLATYANKRFLGLFIALALRLLNSFILVLQSASPWPSLFRIGAIIISSIFVFKKLMTGDQRQSLVAHFKTSNLSCGKCGTSVKVSDAFCPKCGNRM